MRSYGELANRYLKKNKKRNIYTIIGIILVSILFISINYIVNFSITMEKNLTYNTLGKYEIGLKNISDNSIDKIENNAKVLSIRSIREYESKMNQDINLSLYAFSNDTYNEVFEKKLKIIKGEFPTNKDEVLISKRLEEKLKISLGKNIVINKKSYKIKGIFLNEGNIINDNYSIIGESFKGKEIDSYYVIQLKNNSIRNVKNFRKTLGQLGIDIERLSINNLDEYNGLEEEVYGMYAINITLVIFTVILVYGIVSMSLKEREKQVSLLRCIGATKEKIRYLILKETFITGIIGITLGIIIGECLSIYLVNLSFSRGISETGVNPNIYLKGIFEAIFLMGVSIYISTKLPLRKLLEIKPIEGLKGGKLRGEVYKNKGELIKKHLGYEMFLAYRNLKRTHKNFYITVIILSLMFVVFTSFSTYLYFDNRMTTERNSLNKKELEINIYPELGEKSTEIKMLEKAVEAYSNNKFDLEVRFNLETNITGISIEDQWQNGQDNSKNYSRGIQLIAVNNNWFNENKKYIDGNKNLEEFNRDGIIFIETNINKTFVKRESINFIKWDKKIGLKVDENKFILTPMGSIGTEHVREMGLQDTWRGVRAIVSTKWLANNSKKLKFEKIYNKRVVFLFNENKEKSLRTLKTQATNNGGEIININEQTASYKSAMNTLRVSVYLIIGLLLIIIIIGIVNSKNIYLNLRKKEIGTMIAIGMSRKKLKRIILYEGILQGTIAGVIGIVLSIPIISLIWIYFVHGGYIMERKIPLEIIVIGIVLILAVNIVPTIMIVKKIDVHEVLEMLKEE